MNIEIELNEKINHSDCNYFLLKRVKRIEKQDENHFSIEIAGQTRHTTSNFDYVGEKDKGKPFIENGKWVSDLECCCDNILKKEEKNGTKK